MRALSQLYFAFPSRILGDIKTAKYHEIKVCYCSIWHEFHETCHSVTFYFMKKTTNDAVTPQRQSQFTPKMKANAVPRLLSSLV